MIFLGNRVNKNRVSFPLFVLFVLGCAAPRQIWAATYEVGAGQSYATLASLPTLNPGDVVNVHCGVYNEVRQWFDSGTAASPITLQGACSTGRPIIDGNGLDTSGNGGPRGDWEFVGNYYQVRNLEFRNARNGENAAGIRVMSNYVTITNVLVDYNDMGIMTSSDAADNLLVQNSEIAYNGTGYQDGQSHNVYTGIGGTITFQYCYIHDSVSGENFKSRAHWTQLFYNFIAYGAESEVEGLDNTDTEGPNSNMVMIGNLLVSTPNRTVNTTKFINFGQDDGGTHNGTLYLINNTLIAATTDIGFLRSSASNSSVIAINNVFYGSNTIVNTTYNHDISGSNNWFPNTANIPSSFTNSTTGTDPGFLNPGLGDFHLLATSPARNIGIVNPTFFDGNGVSHSGIPTLQYLSPLNSTARPTDTGLDAGAFGYSGTGGSSGAPDLMITEQHIGSFMQGEPGIYTMTVSNNGTAATNGAVTVADVIPTGMTATSVTGTGWNCTTSPVSCSRTDPLSPGFSYPSITLLVTFASNAPSSLVNTVTVSVNGDSNAANNMASDTAAINSAASATGTVSFLKIDTTTGGTWKGISGVEGYDVIGDTASFPSYVSVTPSGNSLYVWDSAPTDTRALQKGSSSSSRIAACWFAPNSMSINLSFNDSSVHQVALYLLDWDGYGGGRSERVDVLDANGSLLDTRSITSFTGGQYLVWNLTGKVILRITNANPLSNAVVSGLFFGAGTVTVSGTATFVKSDASKGGTWKGTYGGDGGNVTGDIAVYPTYVTVTPTGNSSWIWASSSSDTRAAQKISSSTDRIAACWYTAGSMTIDMKFSDQNTHQVALYLLDWDGYGGGRSERVDVLDANTYAVLDTRTVSSFSSGLYLVWNLSGHVIVRVTNINANSNAIVSGVFFGGSSTQTAPQAGTAAFVTTDTASAGSWKASYGGDGFNVFGDLAAYPSYVTVTPAGNGAYTWGSSSDPRAMQKSESLTDRIASCWYSPTYFTIDLNFGDANTHKTAVYVMDWDGYGGGRSERVDVLDSNGNLLDSRTVSGFSSGQYLVWNLSGHIILRITNANSNSNALVNGIFFGPGAGSTASFVKTDGTTGGNWKGAYGLDGANIIDDASMYPTYAVVTPSFNSAWLWNNTTTDMRALQQESSTSGRIAAAWYSSSGFTIDVVFTDGKAHQVGLYLLDWDGFGGGRSERIDIFDAQNHTLDSRNVASFVNGEYLVWTLSGHVLIQVTNTNPLSNAVLSGMFFR